MSTNPNSLLELEEKCRKCWTETFEKAFVLIKEDRNSMSFDAFMDRMFMLAYHTRLRLARSAIERTKQTLLTLSVCPSSCDNELNSFDSGNPKNQCHLAGARMLKPTLDPTIDCSDSETGSESDFQNPEQRENSECKLLQLKSQDKLDHGDEMCNRGSGRKKKVYY